MTSTGLAIILFATLVTAFISGIFGMAGGLILMGVLLALVPVATAMIVHGVLQFIANIWRAILLRQHIDWKATGIYAAGGALGILSLLGLAWRPDKQLVFLLLGLMPALIWLPKRLISLDIQKPVHAFGAGFAVQLMNTLAGVAGPLLDIFFVQTSMSRFEIVATKSTTQSISHLVKVAFWTMPLLAAAEEMVLPPLWFFALAIPLSVLGTWMGGRVLARMNDGNFQGWMKAIVSVTGLIYLARAAGWM